MIFLFYDRLTLHRSQGQSCKPDFKHFKHFKHHWSALLTTVHSCNCLFQHRPLPLPLRQIRHQHQRICHLDINRTNTLVISFFLFLSHQPRISISSIGNSCAIARVYPYRSGHLVWSWAMDQRGNEDIRKPVHQYHQFREYWLRDRRRVMMMKQISYWILLEY